MMSETLKDGFIFVSLRVLRDENDLVRQNWPGTVVKHADILLGLLRAFTGL